MMAFFSSLMSDTPKEWICCFNIILHPDESPFPEILPRPGRRRDHEGASILEAFNWSFNPSPQRLSVGKTSGKNLLVRRWSRETKRETTQFSRSSLTSTHVLSSRMHCCGEVHDDFDGSDASDIRWGNEITGNIGPCQTQHIIAGYVVDANRWSSCCSLQVSDVEEGMFMPGSGPFSNTSGTAMPTYSGTCYYCRQIQCQYELSLNSPDDAQSSMRTSLWLCHCRNCMVGSSKLPRARQCATVHHNMYRFDSNVQFLAKSRISSKYHAFRSRS